MNMAISRTPYRVSFFGGGSDYPTWFREEGGAVLSAAIDKYCYISCRLFPSFFNLKYRVVWSHIETVNSVAEILHPAVREGLRMLEFAHEGGLEILHQGDLPARSGMGSSSSFAVGLIKALLALRGETIDRHDLALKAVSLEQDWLKDNVGSQDQVAAAYGGLNIIRFGVDGVITVEPLALDPAVRDRLADHLVLFFTGSGRLASQVAGEVIQRLGEKKTVIRRMRSMVDEAAQSLRTGDLSAFGEMLHETWMLKRAIASGVSNAHVDEIYETARSHGALGGKLLGAGSSGFMLFFVEPERRAELIRSLKHYISVPVHFDDTGAQIIYTSSD